MAKFLIDVDRQSIDRAIISLIEHSAPRFDFFVLVGLSVLMATLGILADSVTVIIGSMLIAPLLYPVLSLSMGIIMADGKLIVRSLITISKSLLLGIGLAALVTVFLGSTGDPYNRVFLNSIEPSILYLMVAVVSGIAGSISFLKPQFNEHLTGVAISVALIPPVAAIGVGIAEFNFAVARAASLQFIINIIGIIFASMVIFSMLNFYQEKTVAKAAVKKEEKEVEKSKNAK
ncbi:MAG: TIGR00341 family protein [Candidatus Doudnabacteria bacterium]